jgi:hypothetical protein
MPVIVIPAGPATGRAALGSIVLLAKELTLFIEAFDVLKATGNSGILKLKN